MVGCDTGSWNSRRRVDPADEGGQDWREVHEANQEGLWVITQPGTTRRRKEVFPGVDNEGTKPSGACIVPTAPSSKTEKGLRGHHVHNVQTCFQWGFPSLGPCITFAFRLCVWLCALQDEPKLTDTKRQKTSPALCRKTVELKPA
jgi:hypothetical protein